mgnify:CR=1 FL=1
MVDAAHLTADLIRCPSVTPNEGGALKILETRLSNYGFLCTRVNRGKVSNLFARWGTGKTFGFNGHTDVVPVGDVSSWSVDPFGAEIHDGWMYGRGATDMKSGVAAFAAAAIKTQAFHGDVFHQPGTVKTQNDTIYHVFTPFARQWKKQLTDAVMTPLLAPKKQNKINLTTDDIAHYWPVSNVDFRADLWPSSTAEMTQKLHKFMSNAALKYKEIRDFPSIAGTSTLSPYLMCGAISSKQCLLSLRQKSGEWLESTWLNELIWREFYRHLTCLYPRLSRLQDFKLLRAPIPWIDDDRQWQAWCTGQTGYPIVDAAMRQLLQTGWMHNRLRMVVAAFLTKLLLIDWRKGEQFFMQHLIDGDFASNNGGWQWAASTGADAAPYFRIFNPLRQSERFDSAGIFIKKFIPELSSLDKKSIHNPSSQQRKACGYPEPIVDYKFARERALVEYAGAMGKGK